MNTDRTASPVIPALLGVVSALLLGGAGFGLGCLYAGVSGSPSPVARVVPQSGVPAARLLAHRPGRMPGRMPAMSPAPAPGVGGPEEASPLAPPRFATVPASLPSNLPTTLQSRQLGRALAMARPVAGGWVSSHFGQRLDPFTGRPAVHNGLDFAGLDNSAILAVAPGIVTSSGRQRGYGNLIEIDHGGGWITRYGHNAYNLVRVGDYVKPGQTIALMGATGRATGTHLHFEVLYRGRYQNPARFVPQDT